MINAFTVFSIVRARTFDSTRGRNTFIKKFIIQIFSILLLIPNDDLTLLRLLLLSNTTLVYRIWENNIIVELLISKGNFKLRCQYRYLIFHGKFQTGGVEITPINNITKRVIPRNLNLQFFSKLYHQTIYSSNISRIFSFDFFPSKKCVFSAYILYMKYQIHWTKKEFGMHHLTNNEKTNPLIRQTKQEYSINQQRWNMFE